VPPAPPAFCTRYWVRDTKAKIELWIYGFTSKAGCEVFKKLFPDGEEVRHAICCNTPKCNTPDKALDPVRTIMPTPRRA
jgi:hypothetical protein